MMTMKKIEKKAVIFDFYATLVDIHTNERRLPFWQKTASLYFAYGAVYEPGQMRDTYRLFCREEEEKLKEKTGYAYPEIDLTIVFRRLLEEAPVKWKEPEINEDVIYGIANSFRIFSRIRFSAYPHTLETLKALKERGKKLYILSNAQACFTVNEMKAAGVDQYMDDIFLSSDLSMKKPQKEFMETLLKKHDLKKEDCIMVGNDYRSDILIALRNDMDSVFLNTFAYDKKKREEELKEIQKENKDYTPYVIEDGDILHLLDMIQ